VAENLAFLVRDHLRARAGHERELAASSEHLAMPVFRVPLTSADARAILGTSLRTSEKKAFANVRHRWAVGYSIRTAAQPS
jgi:hypothetical protein